MTIDEVREWARSLDDGLVNPYKVPTIYTLTLALLDEHEAPIDCCGEWEPGPCQHCDARAAVEKILEAL